MVFQMAREIKANRSKGHSRGILRSKPTTMLMEPKVSETERAWSLNKTDRFPRRGQVPHSQKMTPRLTKL